MPAEPWQRVKGIFQEALQRPPDVRDAFLGAACGDDARLRSEVDSLLAAHLEAGGFLSQPATRPRRFRARGPAYRALPGRRPSRPRRHGRRVPGGARRRRLPEGRRPQAGARRHGVRVRRATVPAGAPDPGPPPASPHRHHPRRRRDRGRAALSRHGVRARVGRSRRTATSEGLGTRERLFMFTHGLRGGPVRAPEPRGPSRPQARQHPGHAATARRSCSTSASPSCWRPESIPTRRPRPRCSR